ncbi:MAG: aldehyde dehydrogenase family protein, partial [Salinibacterium amurskyense]
MSAPDIQNFINGEYVAARTESGFDVIDPATEDSYAHSPVSSSADVDAAYSAAATAFETWGETTPSERQLALFRIADAMEARADEFADLESKDTGKPRASLVADEIMLSVDQIRFFAGEARHLSGMASGEYMKDHTSSIRREPIGVIGQVAPWNYPLNMAVWKVAPAIAAGNTTVLKPSDTTPSATLLFAEVAAEFLPAGVFNVLTGDRTTGGLMIDHKTPQMVSITGSVRAGMEVAKAASVDLKRVHLELGGKAPVVVFDDADIPAAVAGIGAAGYFNAGQDCTAATRVIVHANIHDEFVAELVKWTR